MTSYRDRAGMKVAGELAAFIEERALPGTGIDPDAFWRGTAEIFARFAPENRALLAERERMQAAIDAWHDGHPGPVDQRVYQAMLRDLGYLVPEPAPFTIGTEGVDDEIARIAGPQLVVPILNARFLLNAAKARWGSLYDALYGTDALGTPSAGGYDIPHGAAVIARARRFLDETLPLASGSWSGLTSPEAIVIADPSRYVGASGKALLFCHHGLHVEVVFDRDHSVGRDDPAGIADVILESALTTICDLEDSVAAVDAADKVAAYDNWLGLMRGDLAETFDKGGRTVTRRLAEDRRYRRDDGGEVVLPGTSLLLVRHVGHLMTTPAVLIGGEEAPEGILDAIVTSLAALHGRGRNGRTGAIYIVKPKMHGPDEAAFANRLFDAVEDLLGLPRHTIKIGVMDEERRTSANLAATIAAVRDRVFFVNTGFLDRTGDEIYTAMRAGPMVRKGEIKSAGWIGAYEDRNVQVALACGFASRAQIGKGMWAMPDRMADMLAQKVAHPAAGASTAWVPSPTAATLHALHYHAVDVAARQAARMGEQVGSLDALLTPPIAWERSWSANEIREEIETNVQGILGYVVRWIDQGVGCSKVPDLAGVGLMEDRATLRISAQHIANWLLHGVITAREVEAAFVRMAATVDMQNADDPAYRSLLAPGSIAMEAARALVFEGSQQPSGYTEPLLHRYRVIAKQRTAQDVPADGPAAFARFVPA